MRVPHPAGIVAPVKEKPKTVVEEDDTVNSAAAASPPSALVISAPSTLN